MFSKKSQLFNPMKKTRMGEKAFVKVANQNYAYNEQPDEMAVAIDIANSQPRNIDPAHYYNSFEYVKNNVRLGNKIYQGELSAQEDTQKRAITNFKVSKIQELNDARDMARLGITEQLQQLNQDLADGNISEQERNQRAQLLVQNFRQRRQLQKQLFPSNTSGMTQTRSSVLESDYHGLPRPPNAPSINNPNALNPHAPPGGQPPNQPSSQPSQQVVPTAGAGAQQPSPSGQSVGSLMQGSSSSTSTSTSPSAQKKGMTSKEALSLIDEALQSSQAGDASTVQPLQEKADVIIGEGPRTQQDIDFIEAENAETERLAKQAKEKMSGTLKKLVNPPSKRLAVFSNPANRPRREFSGEKFEFSSSSSD